MAQKVPKTGKYIARRHRDAVKNLLKSTTPASKFTNLTATLFSRSHFSHALTVSLSHNDRIISLREMLV